jgi:hypothetical protein
MRALILVVKQALKLEKYPPKKKFGSKLNEEKNSNS